MSIKDKYFIERIDKKHARHLVKSYHYLGGKDFLCSYAYGLIDASTFDLVGCAVFGSPNGNVTLKGWFGVENDSEEAKGIFELTRLVVKPELNGSNITSYFLSHAIKRLRKEVEVKAIISLADASRHVGYIYQACNFKYYGLSMNKKDFYMYAPEREKGYILNPRQKVKDKEGVWLNRSVKHRYAIVFDKSLKVNHEEQPFPKKDKNGGIIPLICCNGNKVVKGNIGMRVYSCPVCTGVLELIEDNSLKSIETSILSTKGSESKNEVLVSNKISFDNF